MKFDFNLGSEAVFDEWVDDGCKKAMAILDAIERVDIPGAAKLINQDSSVSEPVNHE